jgi:hypothetical protein
MRTVNEIISDFIKWVYKESEEYPRLFLEPVIEEIFRILKICR